MGSEDLNEYTLQKGSIRALYRLKTGSAQVLHRFNKDAMHALHEALYSRNASIQALDRLCTRPTHALFRLFTGSVQPLCSVREKQFTNVLDAFSSSFTFVLQSFSKRLFLLVHPFWKHLYARYECVLHTAHKLRKARYMRSAFVLLT